MATKRYAMGLALALGCSSTGESSGSDATGATTTTTTSTVTSSGEATSTGMTTAEAPTTSSGSTSSSTTVVSESTSESTGEPPVCEGGRAALLFGTAENIGTISYPNGGGPYLWGMQSWFNGDTGEYEESADDFEVPAGVCWCVASVVAFGQFGPAPAQPEFSLRLYEDADGLPVTDPWFTQDLAPSAIESVMLEPPALAGTKRYQFELEEDVLVQPGHAWLSTSGLVSGAVVFNMALSTESFGAASTAYRSTECPVWGDLQACYPTLPLPELAFELHGYEIPCM
ncbi:hypothetical protein [Nannocystis sp. SCPEA4]|uniref:hypothetical protein n=1 Tax=Nannocystis sp. SCPEA4 TaxID=2996787 RepID=UPI00226F596F|nr:hypothetical protein [Nannocystis sp. SCPEA4]MCY1059127.1 hypothetical protein [Nannocystis sp. SCPEA4]